MPPGIRKAGTARAAAPAFAPLPAGAQTDHPTITPVMPFPRGADGARIGRAGL
jgi:hypothetical protein